MDRFQTQSEMQLRTLLLPCSYKPLQEPSRLYNAEINGASYKTFKSNILINIEKILKNPQPNLTIWETGPNTDQKFL